MAEASEDAPTIHERGIVCPKCKACRDWRVYKTAQQVDETWRYRVCQKCGHRLRTVEKTLAKWLENTISRPADKKPQ